MVSIENKMQEGIDKVFSEDTNEKIKEKSEEMGEKMNEMGEKVEKKLESLIADFNESKVGKTLAHIFEKKDETIEELAEKEPVVELIDKKGKEMVEMTLKDPEESTKYEAWGAADHLKEAATKATSKMMRDIQHIARGKNYYNNKTLEKTDRDEIDVLAKSWVESLGDKFDDINTRESQVFQHDGFYKIDPIDLRNNDPRLFEQLQSRAEEIQQQRKLGYGDFYKPTSEIEVLNSRVKDAETKVQSVQEKLETAEIQNEILTRIVETDPNAKDVDLGTLPETQGIDALTPTLKTFLEKHNITAELDDKNNIKLVRNAEKTQENNADTETLDIYKQQMAAALKTGGKVNRGTLHQIGARLNIERRNQGLGVPTLEQVYYMAEDILNGEQKDSTNIPNMPVESQKSTPVETEPVQEKVEKSSKASDTTESITQKSDPETPFVEATKSPEPEKPQELTMEEALEKAEISTKEKDEIIYYLEKQKTWGTLRRDAKAAIAMRSRNRVNDGKPEIDDGLQEILLSEVYGEKTPEDEDLPEINLEELMKEPV